MQVRDQLWIQGGGEPRGSCPLSLLKLVIKKMAAICGALYFMFLAHMPILDPLPVILVVKRLPGAASEVNLREYTLCFPPQR